MRCFHLRLSYDLSLNPRNLGFVTALFTPRPEPRCCPVSVTTMVTALVHETAEYAIASTVGAFGGGGAVAGAAPPSEAMRLTTPSMSAAPSREKSSFGSRIFWPRTSSSPRRSLRMIAATSGWTRKRTQPSSRRMSDARGSMERRPPKSMSATGSTIVRSRMKSAEVFTSSPYTRKPGRSPLELGCAATHDGWRVALHTPVSSLTCICTSPPPPSPPPLPPPRPPLPPLPPPPLPLPPLPAPAARLHLGHLRPHRADEQRLEQLEVGAGRAAAAERRDDAVRLLAAARGDGARAQIRLPRRSARPHKPNLPQVLEELALRHRHRLERFHREEVLRAEGRALPRAAEAVPLLVRAQDGEVVRQPHRPVRLRLVGLVAPAVRRHEGAARRERRGEGQSGVGALQQDAKDDELPDADVDGQRGEVVT